MANLTDNNLLQYLDTLLKYSSFTKAANDLCISQPYLTQVIKKIETRVGTRILERGTNSIHLTEAGHLYYKYLTENIEHTNAFMHELDRFTQKQNTVIRIGVLPTLGSFLLPKFLPQFMKKHPDVKIILKEAMPDVSEENTVRGDLDFYIGQTPAKVGPQLECRVLGNDSYYLLIPEGSRYYQPGEVLVDESSFDLVELLKEPVVMTTAGSAIRQQTNVLMHKHGIDPNIVLESGNIYTTATLAAKGVGGTIIPATIAAHLKKGSYNLCLIPKEVLSLEYFIAYPKGEKLPENKQELVDLFMKIDISECTKGLDA